MTTRQGVGRHSRNYYLYKWPSLAARDAGSATWLAQQADEVRQAKRARTGDGAPTSQPRANDTIDATLSE